MTKQAIPLKQLYSIKKSLHLNPNETMGTQVREDIVTPHGPRASRERNTGKNLVAKKIKKENSNDY